jgi:hypothetical protein
MTDENLLRQLYAGQITTEQYAAQVSNSGIRTQWSIIKQFVPVISAFTPSGVNVQCTTHGTGMTYNCPTKDCQQCFIKLHAYEWPVVPPPGQTDPIRAEKSFLFSKKCDGVPISQPIDNPNVPEAKDAYLITFDVVIEIPNP